VNSGPPPVQEPTTTSPQLHSQTGPYLYQQAASVYAQAAPQFYPQAGPQPYARRLSNIRPLDSSLRLSMPRLVPTNTRRRVSMLLLLTMHRQHLLNMLSLPIFRPLLKPMPSLLHRYRLDGLVSQQLLRLVNHENWQGDIL